MLCLSLWLLSICLSGQAQHAWQHATALAQIAMAVLEVHVRGACLNTPDTTYQDRQ